MTDDFLPPIPNNEIQDEPQSEELKSLLAELPIEAEASASTDSPMELIASSATQPSTSSTVPAALES